ncbi:putative aldehyde dehydrogenase [Trypoxylus dichotomus]
MNWLVCADKLFHGIFLYSCWKIGAVLSMENNVVLKPAEQIPSPPLYAAQLNKEAGLPAEVTYQGLFFNAGQVWYAGSRTYIEAPIYDEFDHLYKELRSVSLVIRSAQKQNRVHKLTETNSNT